MARINLRRELQSFTKLWSGGFHGGDPLDPLGYSTYAAMGYMSVLHATYLACIKPYVHADTVALEIGPGRGAWTRALLPAREVWCLDALSAEHNGFWEYVGKQSHVRYFKVEDFECNELPDNHFDYVFSFGCLCHVSFDGITAYLTNLRRKLKPGANCFLFVADYDKYNAALEDIKRLYVGRAYATGRRYAAARWVWRTLALMGRQNRMFGSPLDKNESPEHVAGRWYHAGVSRTCGVLRELGYEVVDEDVGTIHRDPIIHFRRP
jgi:SAM-dependent methyltransferase